MSTRIRVILVLCSSVTQVRNGLDQSIRIARSLAHIQCGTLCDVGDAEMVDGGQHRAHCAQLVGRHVEPLELLLDERPVLLRPVAVVGLRARFKYVYSNTVLLVSIVFAFIMTNARNGSAPFEVV